ncbi:hypothetical protein FBU59_000165 [Linderina macrospora]|uniref:Uncharacterized protein n=1 Tax=Linderina macrospora TaxID=4868 RepID=A0ACC1JHL3_9FUNG|nr:hypothetical protein FBU59_000165 [Linderina macrospora]
METSARYNYYLQTNALDPLSPQTSECLRQTAEHTTQELTVFLSFAEVDKLVGEHGWVMMQRRVSDVYAITARRAVAANVIVDVVLVDFCAYSADDMAIYANTTTLADTSGGTFDHIHLGHKILLTAAALTATQKLTIGVSAEALLAKKKFKDYLEPYRVREMNVLLFLRKIRKDIIFELVPIYDIYGPTIVDASIGALVVSQETVVGCEVLNERRAERGMPPMQILAVDLVSAGGTDKLSSTAIREALFEKAG